MEKKDGLYQLKLLFLFPFLFVYGVGGFLLFNEPDAMSPYCSLLSQR
ncbi:hypothetical protein ACTNDZ_12375 [Selenomonas montiformis]